MAECIICLSRHPTAMCACTQCAGWLLQGLPVRGVCKAWARMRALWRDGQVAMSMLYLHSWQACTRPAGGLDLADVEPTAAAIRQALALAHSAAADGPYGPREQVHPAAAAVCAHADAAAACSVAAAGLVRSMQPALHPVIDKNAVLQLQTPGSASAQAQAEAAAACPVAAAGLVRCMRPALGAAGFWREHHGSAVPAFLRALALIIPAQPLLHAQVTPSLRHLVLCAWAPALVVRFSGVGIPQRGRAGVPVRAGVS